MLKLGGKLGFTGTVTGFSLKQKCNTEAVKRLSLAKSATLALIISFLVFSFDDEYEEEDATKKTITTTTRTTMKTTATTTATTTKATENGDTDDGDCDAYYYE